MSEIYTKAEEKIIQALGQQGVQVEKVGITNQSHSHGYVDEKGRERLHIAARIPNLRELNEKEVTQAATTALQAQLDGYALPDGSKLIDKYDLTHTVPKSRKEELEALKAQIEEGLNTQGVVHESVATLLRNADFLNPDSKNNSGFYGGLHTNDDHVEATFSIHDGDEAGQKSTHAMVEENILARKEAILTDIRKVIKAKGIEGITDEDLAKLDLQVNEYSYGEKHANVSVSVGLVAPVDPAKPDEKRVGKFPALAGLPAEMLQSIIMDSILFSGQDADKVASVIAGQANIRHLVGMYADKVPAFAEALKSDLLKEDCFFGQDEEKDAKIRPNIEVNTSLDKELKSRDIVNISLTLPEGVTTAAFVAHMAGQQVAAPAAQAGNPALTMVEGGNQQPVTAENPHTPTLLTEEAGGQATQPTWQARKAAEAAALPSVGGRGAA